MTNDNSNSTPGNLTPPKTRAPQPADLTRKPGSGPCSKAKPAACLPRSPTLRFSPTAWAKLLYLRDLGETEVGGFPASDHDAWKAGYLANVEHEVLAV